MKLINCFLQNAFVRIYIISQIITRFILSAYGIANKQIIISDLPTLFFIGTINDIVSLAYILPTILLISIIFSFLFNRYPNCLRLIRVLGCFIILLIMVCNIVSELSFWDEFGTRYNFIAVDYLIYTQEIIGTLKESLPLTEIICGIFLLSLIICRLCIRILLSKETDNISKLYLSIISTIIAYGAFSVYSPDKILLSNNVYVQELGRNGPYEFVSAFYNNSLDYYRFYQSIESKEALGTVRSLIGQDNQTFIDNTSISRSTKASGRERKYNIVMIVVESLSAEYLSDFGNKYNITPNLDRLAKDSLFFSKIYATGTRTVRGLEALTLGNPPLPGSSIIRRPNNSRLFNIGTVFANHGYQNNFIFGGFSYFDNLENYFSHNGYNVIDRKNLSKDEISFANIWGVADEDIFNKALEVNDKASVNHTPFFSMIMTTSNHRPYTFPDNRIDLPSGGGRHAAVKYTDYAIGKFIDDARKKPWFKDTIFIITADHCASSAGKTHLPVEKYHIPLLIYAPEIIKPSMIDNIASQIDILPTIFGLLNFSYESKFMGRDIINSPSNKAFISTYQLLGYLKEDNLVILHPRAKPSLYKINQGSKELIIEPDTSGNEMIKEAISFYQTSYELFTSGKMHLSW